MIANIDSNQVIAPLIIDTNSYEIYSYILLPCYENGTLLDLLMTANSKEI